MFRQLIFLFLFSISLETNIQPVQGHFCYNNPICGPFSNEWPELCKKGHNQSPIDLPYNKGTIQKAKKQQRTLELNEGYSFPHFYILNNGHSIQVSFTPELNSKAEMSGFGFDYPYIFAQGHFHWSNKTSEGSEHTLNGAHFPMELHLVHFSSKYSSFSEAAAVANDPKSLAVLSIFLTPDHSIESNEDNGLEIIANNLPLDFGDQAFRINKTLDLNPLLPKPGQMYYRYMGSLTTPGCNEDVEWTVIADPVSISPLIYEKFQFVNDIDGEPMEKNFRPVMSLEARNVEFYQKASSSTQKMGLTILLLSFSIVLLINFLNMEYF